MVEDVGGRCKGDHRKYDDLSLKSLPQEVDVYHKDLDDAGFSRLWEGGRGLPTRKRKHLLGGHLCNVQDSKSGTSAFVVFSI